MHDSLDTRGNFRNVVDFPRSNLLVRSFALVTLLLGSAALAQHNTPDLSKDPTLYVVGYAHLDTEWRWEYPQVINEYLRKTMEDNFKLFDKYPHYLFNFSGANRYRLMKEYYPEDFAKLKRYVDEGRWFPAGSSMEEGDVNTPSAETIIRQILYGNEWFRREFGKTSAEYMLPDCFGFPASLPTILAHSGVKGFSTQKLVWGSSAPGGGPESIEKTPEGTPFDVGVWVGPDGESVLAGLNPGSYGGGIETDLSKPLPSLPPNTALDELKKKVHDLRAKLEEDDRNNKLDPKELEQYYELRRQRDGFNRAQQEDALNHYQNDWAKRVEQNGAVSGVFTDYHYYGTGDIGGTPEEDSVKRLEAIVTNGIASLPASPANPRGWQGKVGDGPVHVISATSDQMFLDIHPEQAKNLPRYTGEMELTNHSAGSLTSQGYQKRWLRKEELLAEAAEEASVAAEWLGARKYPLERLNNAWTLQMGGHFHDIAAGTATPKSYEFAWNDDVIALNQFAGVLTSASEGVASAMDTEAKGTPVVVFNPLNISREDVVEAVEASVDAPPSTSARVVGPDGKEVPSQIENGKIVFVAKAPPVGYAVYDLQAGAKASQQSSALHVSEDSLENQYYRVKLNSDGDVASIFDKSLDKELLAAPARLAISYDNPEQWPAWNMDWDQEQAAPKAYVGGPANIRVVERGPVRVAIEVTRQTAGSRFVQIIRLSAGDAGKRVEFGNIIDWNTKESNLKAMFPLTASNRMATYNWDIGTIQRPTAEPKKFEVPSHQWIDLTDMSGTFGATILTDCKNGSDKPSDNTIRLTLIRTPGVRGGYPDQATQDIGHHEFFFGIAGHSGDWRSAQTDWQGQLLNDPLLAFESSSHAGLMGREFSFLNVSNPRIRVLALKKAEHGDEIVFRAVELDGKPQENVKITFATQITSAREINGQEQPVGPATLTNGSLVSSFTAYEPRTFAIKLAQSKAKATSIRSEPVSLSYDLATATPDGTHSVSGFDGHGNSLPAEVLPAQITFDDVKFQLASATGANAVIAKGQNIALPEGNFKRVYILAASANGDQKAGFEVGGKQVDLNIEDWSGFIGQWDDRHWSKSGANDDYGDMTGLTPGFIKRADLAWYCSHHHNSAGENVPYSYSYLFAYAVDLPPGAMSIKLPANENIRIFAMSVSDGSPTVHPAQPLYDVLPFPKSGSPDFLLASSSPKLTVLQGSSETVQFVLTPLNGFEDKVTFTASGIPAGVSANFHSGSATEPETLTLTANGSASGAPSTVTISASAGNISHSTTVALTVVPRKHGSVPVDLSSAYNVHAIYNDGAKFTNSSSMDGGGFAYSGNLLAAHQAWNGVQFKLGAPDVLNAASGKEITLPTARFRSLSLLATVVDGSQGDQVFTVNYADGTRQTIEQSLSDWYAPSNFPGEFKAVTMPYRLSGTGQKDERTFYLYAYSFDLDPNREVRSISLPDNDAALVFALSLEPPR
jgi:alpha-mannosidase